MRYDMIIVILFSFILFSTALLYPRDVSPCQFKFQCNTTLKSVKRTVILDSRKKRVGDIYDPGHGRRLQIRDNDLRIQGYIENNGRVTDTNRKRIGEVK